MVSVLCGSAVRGVSREARSSSRSGPAPPLPQSLLASPARRGCGSGGGHVLPLFSVAVQFFLWRERRFIAGGMARQAEASSGYQPRYIPKRVGGYVVAGVLLVYVVCCCSFSVNYIKSRWMFIWRTSDRLRASFPGEGAEGHSKIPLLGTACAHFREKVLKDTQKSSS